MGSSEPGYGEIHVDGACIEGVARGVGELSEMIRVIGWEGFSKNVDSCNSYMDELWGLLEDLIIV